MFSKSTLPCSEEAVASGESVTGDSVPEVVEVSKPAVRQFKGPGGKIVEISEDQLERYVSMGLGAHEKFAEAAKMREESQKIIAAAKDSKSALKALELAGHSKSEAREILENELRKIYEEEEEDAKLSPEAKKLREREAELAKYKSEEAERKAAIEQEAASKEEAAYMERIDNEIAEAIESTDLPKHPILGKMMINYMASYASQGQELSAKEAIKYVAADFKVIVRDVLSGMDAKAVKQYLKDDHIKGLRDDAMSEYQSKQKPFDKPAQVAASKQAQPAPENKPLEVKRSKDFFSPFK